MFVTTFLINLRHFVLSLSYLPHVKSWTRFQKFRFFPILTDETFAVLTHAPTAARESPNITFGVSVFNYASWLSGTAVGYYFGDLIPDPRRWGLDFALVALFIGIIVLFLRRTSHLVTLVLAAILTYFFYFQFGWQKNSIAFIAVLASTGGWLWEQRKSS